MSFVEYDAEFNCLKTVSMHQFEEDDIRVGWRACLSLPFMLYDCVGRCG